MTDVEIPIRIASTFDPAQQEVLQSRDSDHVPDGGRRSDKHKNGPAAGCELSGSYHEAEARTVNKANGGKVQQCLALL